MSLPPQLPAVRFDLTDEGVRIYQGGIWNQSFTYFASPVYGQYIMQVTDIPAIGYYSGKIINGQSLNSITPVDSSTYTRGQFVIVEYLLGIWSIASSAPYEDTSAISRIHMQIRNQGQVGTFNTGELIQNFDSATPAANWAPTSVYTVGQIVQPVTANGYWFQCSAAGTSGGSEPTWNTAGFSQVTTDGATLSWLSIGSTGLIQIAPSGSVTWNALLLDSASVLIAPFDYSYDVFFYYGTSPTYRMKRQFGIIRVGPQVTQA